MLTEVTLSITITFKRYFSYLLCFLVLTVAIMRHKILTFSKCLDSSIWLVTGAVFPTLWLDLQLKCNLNITTTQRSHDPAQPSIRHVTFNVMSVHLRCCFESSYLAWLFFFFFTYFLNSRTTVIGLKLSWYPCLIRHFLFFVSVFV